MNNIYSCIHGAQDGEDCPACNEAFETWGGWRRVRGEGLLGALDRIEAALNRFFDKAAALVGRFV